MSPSRISYSATAIPMSIPSINPTNPTVRIVPRINLIAVQINPNRLFISVLLLEQFCDFVLLSLCKLPTCSSEFRMHLIHGENSRNAAYRESNPLPDFPARFDLFVSHTNIPPQNLFIITIVLFATLWYIPFSNIKL